MDINRKPYSWEIEEGYVYFIRSNICEKYIKIGKALKVDRRVSDIDRMNPLGVTLLGYIYCNEKYGHIEKIMHTFFDNKRVNGEWFELSFNDIKSYIKNGLNVHIEEYISNRIQPIYVFNKKLYRHDKVEAKNLHRFYDIYGRMSSGIFKANVKIDIPTDKNIIFNHEVKIEVIKTK